jgi:hypothetical protein
MIITKLRVAISNDSLFLPRKTKENTPQHAVLHSTIKSTCISLTKASYYFKIYYNHELILKYRSHTTISSAMLLSVVAGYEVRVVLTEHTIQTKFYKSQQA